MAKTLFEMDGKTFPTMLAVAEELGRSRVYRKDFERFGIVEIDESQVREIETGEEPSKDDVLESEYPGSEETSEEANDTEEEAKTEYVEPETSDEKRAEVRAKYNFNTVYEWAGEVKAWTKDDIRAALVELGVPEDKISQGNTKGDRMHLVRVFRENLFPGEERPKVGAKAFKHLSTESVIEAAHTNGLDVSSVTAETDTGRRRQVLRVLRENAIHHPMQLTQ